MSDTEQKLKDAQKSIASLIKLANDRADERDAEHSRAEVHKQQKLNTEEDLRNLIAGTRILLEAAWDDGAQRRAQDSLMRQNLDETLAKNPYREAKDTK